LGFSDEDDDLFIPKDALMPEEVALLEFNAMVHLVRVEGTAASTDRSSADNSNGVSDGGDSGGDMGDDLGFCPSARDHRQARFSCSRGRMDEDELSPFRWWRGGRKR